jgi:cobalt-zinc-cadmium efflux system membrane fusion protein
MAATIAGAPDMQAPGVIAYVSPVVAEQSRSALARIVLPNPKGWWRPGLPVQVRVTLAQTQVPVAVQTEAIQRLDDESVVFGRDGGELKAHAVVLGRSDGRVTEVLSGLNAGDRYAATNSFVIKAELGKAGASHEH